MKARDVMTGPAITLRPGTTVPAAASLLCSHGFTAAPVVDTARRLVGREAFGQLLQLRKDLGDTFV